MIINCLVFVRIKAIRGMRWKISRFCAGEGKPKGGRVEMKEGIVKLNGHYTILAFEKNFILSEYNIRHKKEFSYDSKYAILLT